MKLNSKNINNQGFSLVELMVVVAIIGILAAIAIPNVNKYMLKARQSEAKTNLASIYTANKAFYTEYTNFSSDFGAIGFAPEGTLRYNTGFLNLVHNAATGVAGSGIFETKTRCTPPATGCVMYNGATVPAVPAGSDVAGTFQTFQAGSAADFGNYGGTQDDLWTINEQKALAQAQSGL